MYVHFTSNFSKWSKPRNLPYRKWHIFTNNTNKNIYSSTVHDIPTLETVQMTLSRRMDKYIVVYSNAMQQWGGTNYNHTQWNRWISNITQRERSQTRKNQTMGLTLYQLQKEAKQFRGVLIRRPGGYPREGVGNNWGGVTPRWLLGCWWCFLVGCWLHR